MDSLHVAGRWWCVMVYRQTMVLGMVMVYRVQTRPVSVHITSNTSINTTLVIHHSSGVWSTEKKMLLLIFIFCLSVCDGDPLAQVGYRQVWWIGE